jgi:hypothetical protein
VRLVGQTRCLVLQNTAGPCRKTPYEKAEGASGHWVRGPRVTCPSAPQALELRQGVGCRRPRWRRSRPLTRRQSLLHILLLVVLLAEMRNLLLAHEPAEGILSLVC